MLAKSLPVVLVLWNIQFEAFADKKHWFGFKSQFLCHCEGGAECDKESGICPGRCEGGWFGPRCQFVDLAFDPKETITDGKDDTCRQVEEMSILFRRPMYFTWMNMVLKTKVGYLATGTAHGKTIKQKIPLQTGSVGSSTLEVHGEFEALIDTLELRFRGPAEVCSVYVSGGRNVALKQKATQSSANENAETAEKGVASHAVDGGTSSEFHYGTCTHTGDEPVPSFWRLDFDRVMTIDRFRLYNREEGYGCRLHGYRLEGWNQDTSVFTYNDTEDVQTMYEIRLSKPAEVSRVQVTIEQPGCTGDKRYDQGKLSLTICEFMAFGGCPRGTWEPSPYSCKECPLTCMPRVCGKFTGFCFGCPLGYFGDLCDNNCFYRCQEGKCDSQGKCLYCSGFYYDLNRDHMCQGECSEHCSGLGMCNSNTGHCLEGCTSGYYPPTCDKECETSHYGMNCSKTCDVCKADNVTGLPVCHPVTGTCTHGCKIEGTKADYDCYEKLKVVSSRGIWGSVPAAVKLGICLIVFVILVIISMERRRRINNRRETQLWRLAQEKERRKQEKTQMEQETEPKMEQESVLESELESVLESEQESVLES